MAGRDAFDRAKLADGERTYSGRFEAAEVGLDSCVVARLLAGGTTGRGCATIEAKRVRGEIRGEAPVVDDDSIDCGSGDEKTSREREHSEETRDEVGAQQGES